MYSVVDDRDYRLLEEYLKEELRIANAHLPQRRKTLKQLLEEDIPHVLCRDGRVHVFKRRELEYLLSIVGEDRANELLLPILIEVDPSFSELVGIVRGALEVEVISKVLGIRPEKVDAMYLYRSQLCEVRKKLRTTTQYVFSTKYLLEEFRSLKEESKFT